MLDMVWFIQIIICCYYTTLFGCCCLSSFILDLPYSEVKLKCFSSILIFEDKTANSQDLGTFPHLNKQ